MDTLRFEPTVVLGEVRDVTVTQVVDDPHAKVYVIDSNTKYYEATASYCSNENADTTEFELMLYAGDRTLRKDENTTSPTQVTWITPYSWQIVIDPPGRYSCVVVLYKNSVD